MLENTVEKKNDVGEIAIKQTLEAAMDLGVCVEEINSLLNSHGINSIDEINGVGFVSWELFISLLELMAQIESKDIYLDMAKFGVDGKQIRLLRMFLISLWSPKTLYILQEKVTFNMLFGCVDMKITNLSSSKFIITKSIKDGYRDSESFWKFYQRVYELFPTVHNCKPAKVDFIKDGGVGYFLVDMVEEESLLGKLKQRFLTLGTYLKVSPSKEMANRKMVSELARQRASLESSNRALELQNELIEQKIKEKSNILKLFSHDTKNSIMIIQNHIKLMERRIDNPAKLLLSMEKIDKHAGTINDIIMKVADFEKSNASNIIVSKDKTLIGDLVEMSLSHFNNLIMGKEIKVKVDIKDDFFLFVDPVIFSHSVIGNIISNSIKFSPNSSTLEIEAFKEEGLGVVKIRDYGIGMNQEQLTNYLSTEMIWTRDGTQKESGSGLGSKIAQHLLQSLGASFDVYSSNEDTQDYKKGSLFVMKFPLKEAMVQKTYQPEL